MPASMMRADTGGRMKVTGSSIAIVASGLVNLAIATGFERGYGVLKRLGGSPLGRDGLLVAKLVVVAIIGIAQVILLIALALAIGLRTGFDASPIGTVSSRIGGTRSTVRTRT